MSEEKGKVKRKAVSKKTRFEVFKRDSFTCQYCGKKAPDVVLHLEHITPVSRGGKNAITNLVTSCAECNLGKGARTLADNSAITKSQKQAEILQERREQIEMMRDWHLSLVDQKNSEVEAVNDLFRALTNFERIISESHKPEIKKLINKFGLSAVMAALQDGAESYGDPIKALSRLGGICACKSNPFYRKRGYIAAILKSKVGYWNDARFMPLMKRGHEALGDYFLGEAEEFAKSFQGNWTVMMQMLEEIVVDMEDAREGYDASKEY